jgi:methanogenic corrinoid protein MtbC1
VIDTERTLSAPDQESGDIMSFDQAVAGRQSPGGPAGSAGEPAVGDVRCAIRRAVESLVIPRLLGRDQVAINDLSSAATLSLPFSRADRAAQHGQMLARIACTGGPTETLDYLARLRERGLGFDDLLRDAICPAARHLGDLWSDDRLTFFEVTLAAGRLTQAVHAIGAESGETVEPQNAETRVLLALAPGEQHRVGIVMIEELLRRDGCEVMALHAHDTDDVIEAAGSDWFDAAAFSVSSRDLIKPLKDMIFRLRHASRNPGLQVLVGGAAVGGDTARARRMGADATALDAWQTVLHMRWLKRSVASQYASLTHLDRVERDHRSLES